MTSTVDFGWKPTTTAIFVGIRHVGVNAPHHFSQKPPLKKPRERDSDSGGKEGEGRGDNLLPPAPDRRTAAAAHYRYTGARYAGALI